jgi:DNA-binding MarR family transcriptional regulator
MPPDHLTGSPQIPEVTPLQTLSALKSVGTPYELRHGDLRARLVLSSRGTTNVLNRLEKGGFIERECNPSDARTSWVRLTKAGIDIADLTVKA